MAETDDQAGSHRYTTLEMVLHWIALESRLVRRTSFDMECGRFNDPAARGWQNSVYVSGLARSGTTLVLNILAGANVFRSLTYADMPFVMAPNLWGKLSLVNGTASTQRAHGDGMLVSTDSPEAFEEVFWETFRSQKAQAGCYDNVPSSEALALFRDYRSVIANPKGSSLRKRYLSKNNNNLSRLHVLAAEESAKCLLVVRDPLAVAASLFKLHQTFSRQQQNDKFGRRYMKWLAHHEFGIDHLPFAFAKPNMNKALTPDQPDYWLDYWTAVHRHLATLPQKNLLLVDYDGLCAEPRQWIEKLAAFIDCPLPTPAFAINQRSGQQNNSLFSANLCSEALALHKSITASGSVASKLKS